MDDFDPDQTFGFNLYDAARLLRRDFERRAKRHGVTRAQWVALVFLLRQPGLKQSQLADLLEVTPIAVARLVDRMENDGLLERRADPDDRRAWRLHLTAKAQARVQTMREIGREAREVALAGIAPAELEQVLATLRRVRANLAAARAAD